MGDSVDLDNMEAPKTLHPRETADVVRGMMDVEIVVRRCVRREDGACPKCKIGSDEVVVVMLDYVCGVWLWWCWCGRWTVRQVVL